MVPRFGALGSKKQDDLKAQGRVVLRAIATIAAVCGVILNIIAVVTISRVSCRLRWWDGPKHLLTWAFLPLVTSLVWDLMHLGFRAFQKSHPYLQIGGDTLVFVGFLVILIENGVLATRIGWSVYVHIDKVLLLAYNSFPWIVCAYMHLCLAIYPILDKVDWTKLPKLRIEWPNKSSAHALLPADDYDEDDEDVEARPKTKDPDRRGDTEEESPLLGSS